MKYELRTVDGERVRLDEKAFNDFLKDNDFDPDMEKELRALKPGHTYGGGGGAQPDWSIKRVGGLVGTEALVARVAQRFAKLTKE